MNPDFRDLFCAFNDAEVRFLVVGAYAVIFHTEPRYTKDLDIWIEPTPTNAQSAYNALASFGAPVADITVDDLCNQELVYQIGIEPNRVDILMDIGGPAFSQAWTRAEESTYGDQPIRVIGIKDLIAAKRATGRPQDLLDVSRLESALKRR
jgi:hypothetical protein